MSAARKEIISDDRPVRERLREWAASHPGATAADAARALDVSRQRISQVAEEEGIELVRYATRYPTMTEGLISPGMIGVRTPGIDEERKRPQHIEAVLRVAADLVLRGYEVFSPLSFSTQADLVTVNKITRRTELIVIDLKAEKELRDLLRDPSGFERNATRRAIVSADPAEPIVYQPKFETKGNVYNRG